MKQYLLLCLSLILLVFTNSTASAQCVYTTTADGNFFLPDGFTINPAVFAPAVGNCRLDVAGSTYNINHKVVLNGNLIIDGGFITISATGSLTGNRVDRFLRIIGRTGNGNETNLILLSTPTPERNFPQLNVAILDLRATTFIVNTNSTARVQCTVFLGTNGNIRLGNNSLLNVLGDVDLSAASGSLTGPTAGTPAGLRIAGRLRGNSGAAAGLFSPDDFLTTCVQGTNPIACSTSSGAPYQIPATLINDPTCISVLPVTLTSFVGHWAAGGTAVNLKWSTATELDNDFFAVERSADGITFEKVTQIEGAGNSTMLRHYAYTDASPLASSSHYRLRQVDYDGKATYSPIISLGKPQRSTDWLVATSLPRHFTIQGQLDPNSRFSVLDIAGKPVFSQAVSTENTEVVIPALPTGIYLFRLTTKQGRFTIRQAVTTGN